MGVLYTDLTELKQVLQIDPANSLMDYQLSLFNEWTGSIFDEFFDREVSYGTRTWVYPGTGNQKLPLRHRPVYPTTPPPKAAALPFTAIQVTVLEGANWGDAVGGFSTVPPLVFGEDYAIRIDRDDGGSREAILYNLRNYWPRPVQRQAGLLSPFVGPDMGSIQVIYTAGFTVDTMPAILRGAADMLITRLNNLFPLGQQLSSESYIERSIGLTENQRRYLLGVLRPFLFFWKNWTF